MGFPRQEYWTGLPFPSPGDLPDPEVEPTSLMSPAMAGKLFTTTARKQYTQKLRKVQAERLKPSLNPPIQKVRRIRLLFSNYQESPKAARGEVLTRPLPSQHLSDEDKPCKDFKNTI